MKIYDSITDLIGNTPLVKINKLLPGSHATILAKLEFFNPLSSIKDRIAGAMIDDAEKKGLINKDSVLIEPTSGNTGIALAFIAAKRGYRLILTMPESMSIERRRLLKVFGAELVLTETKKGMSGAVAKADELARTIPNSYVLQQFNNPSNTEIHRTTTGPEIWKDTDGQVDVVIAGVGTGGTISGIGEYLKSVKPEVKIIAVEPYTSAVLSGNAPGSHKIQGIGAGFIPGNFNRKVVDEIITVKDADSGIVARETAKLEGLPVGISSGATLWAAMEVAKRPESKGKTIVAIIASSAERYLSTWLFEDLV